MTALAETPYVPHPGDLIKNNSSNSVYYVGLDEKRHAFPNDRVFASWSLSFESVITVSDGALASYPLGVNITYRPGFKLIKIQTDPKVYAIGGTGMLRWIKTEALAVSLYGTDWNQKIDDVSDAFFTNYEIGEPIDAVEDYSVNFSFTHSSLYDRTCGEKCPAPAPVITTTNTTSSTTATTTAPGTSGARPDQSFDAFLDVDTDAPLAGSTITITASATQASGVAKMNIYVDGNLLDGCSRSPCVSRFTIPHDKLEYIISADARWFTGETSNTKKSIFPTTNNTSIKLSVTNPEVKPGKTQEIVVDITNALIARYIDIYRNGVVIKGCQGTQVCRYTFTETGAIGDQVNVYAVADNATGVKARSQSVSYTIVANDRPRVSVEVGNTTISRGNTVDVKVSAADSDEISWTELWLDGTRLKQCSSSLCTMDAGPWSATRTLEFVGRASDTLGAIGEATSTMITVQ